MATVDLWPSDLKNVAQSEGPSLILSEQAKLLAQKTGGLVEAHVSTDVYPGSGKPSYFADTFMLFSPSLNYRYPLFSIRYSVKNYPVLIMWGSYRDQLITDESGNDELRDGFKQVFTREDLETELQHIFSNKETIQVIGNLTNRSHS